MREPVRLWCVTCQLVYDHAPENAGCGCPECGCTTWVAARYAPHSADVTAKEPTFVAQALGASARAN
jgi:predicted  nucleic acid-binding Zn-ribbon protein